MRSGWFAAVCGETSYMYKRIYFPYVLHVHLFDFECASVLYMRVHARVRMY